MTEAHPAIDPTFEPPVSEAVADRTISPVASRLSGLRPGKAIAFVGLLVGCGVFVAATLGADRSGPSPAPEAPVKQLVRFEPAPAPTLAAPGPDAPRIEPDAEADAVPALSASAAAAPAATPPARPAGLTPIVAYRRSSAGELALPVVMAEAGAPAAIHDLDALRQPSRIGGARARRLGDRNYLLLAGASLPCLLQTAMDSTAPGYVSCLIPRDVLSDNGAVVLMEKGTRVLGEYRGGLRQGQGRLFVLWTRAVTPTGVAIDFASPASDALGRSGFGGEVDTQFWKRFGGAVLMSIVDAGAGAVTVEGSSGQVVRLPSDAADVALGNAADIKPILRKTQGAEVGIFLTQDFDFSSVYGLADRAP